VNFYDSMKSYTATAINEYRAPVEHSVMSTSKSNIPVQKQGNNCTHRPLWKMKCDLRGVWISSPGMLDIFQAPHRQNATLHRKNGTDLLPRVQASVEWAICQLCADSRGIDFVLSINGRLDKLKWRDLLVLHEVGVWLYVIFSNDSGWGGGPQDVAYTTCAKGRIQSQGGCNLKAGGGDKPADPQIDEIVRHLTAIARANVY
jgi:hypothetical protein